MMSDKEKKAKLAILEEIRCLMEEGDDDRLKPKKSAAPDVVEIELEPASEGDDLDARFQEQQDEKESGDHESDEDDDLKEKLMEMYSKLK